MDQSYGIPHGPGLSIISQHGDDDVADIVFIHGLGGSSLKTWGSQDVFWPRDLLSNDLPDVRIITFDYDASPTAIFTANNMRTTKSAARDLVEELYWSRAEQNVDTRPLIFIAHSLGGVMLKEALVLSSDRVRPGAESIVENTDAIIFMGTPHVGSNIAMWSSILNRTIKSVTHTRNLAPAPIEGLEDLARIQSRFHELLRERSFPELHIVNFYETLAAKNLGRVIVSRESATLVRYPSYPIAQDHRSMTKFQHPSDDGYQLVLGELRKCLLRIRPDSDLAAYGDTGSFHYQHEVRSGQANFATATTADEEEGLEDADRQLLATVSELVEQGKFERAEELLRELLDRRLLAFAEDNLTNIKLLGRLASIMWQQGRWSQAEPIQVANVEKMTNILGPHDVETLIAKENLASTWVELGRIEEARDLQRDVLSSSRMLFGDGDPRTVHTESNLAVILTRAQQFEEAESLLQYVLVEKERVFGEDDPLIITTRSNLASLYNKMGRFQEAEMLQRQQVHTLERVYGESYPDTLTALDSLASSMGSLGKLEEASEIFTRVLEARKQVLGIENPIVYQSMESLAANYVQRGWLDAAIDVQRQAFDGMLRTLGDKSLVAARSGSTLSLCLARNGQYAEAERNQRSIVDRLRRIYGRDEPNTARAEKILQQIKKERKAASTKQRDSGSSLSSTESDEIGKHSNPAKTTSEDSSDTWSWQTYPAYRMRLVALDQFLVSTFGRYEFYIKRRNDVFQFWIPRQLTKAELHQLEVLQDQDLWGHYEGLSLA